MIAADRNAVSGHLKKALGYRDIRLAGPETVNQITGYEIGSIPPFHWQPSDFVSLVDAALMLENELGVGAGVWGQEIPAVTSTALSFCPFAATTDGVHVVLHLSQCLA